MTSDTCEDVVTARRDACRATMKKEAPRIKFRTKGEINTYCIGIGIIFLFII